VKVAQTPKSPWWIGSAINLTALALAAATTYLYLLGVKHEFLFKLPKFLWALFDYFGMKGLMTACFVLFFAVWWVVALIVAAKLYPAVLPPENNIGIGSKALVGRRPQSPAPIARPACVNASAKSISGDAQPNETSR
jgi:hypothetical protein